MSTDDDVLIVLRAAATLRALHRARDKAESGTPEHARLCAAARALEEQVDHALETVADRIGILEHANDD